jgi:hypothetical protein
MEATTHGITPLRQHMIEDMCMRRMQDRTQAAYIHALQGAGPAGKCCSH